MNITGIRCEPINISNTGVIVLDPQQEYTYKETVTLDCEEEYVKQSTDQDWTLTCEANGWSGDYQNLYCKSKTLPSCIHSFYFELHSIYVQSFCFTLISSRQTDLRFSAFFSTREDTLYNTRFCAPCILFSYSWLYLPLRIWCHCHLHL